MLCLRQLIAIHLQSTVIFVFYPSMEIYMVTTTRSTSVVMTDEARDLHFYRPSKYYPDRKLCGIMTGGVTDKKVEDITQNDIRDGLREAHWTLNILSYVKDHPKEVEILSLFLKMTEDLASKPLEFFTWSCDFGNESGKKCHSIAIRLLTHLSTELQREEFKTLPERATAEITTVVSKYYDGKYGVRSRIEHVKERTVNVDLIFPEPEHHDLRLLILSRDGEISPKKAGKLVLEVSDGATREKYLRQYFDALAKHPKNKLAKKLIGKFKRHLAKYDKKHKKPLEQAARDLCVAGIKKFEPASKPSSDRS